MTDPDGTYPADHIQELIEIYFNSAKNSLGLDMVIGARKGKVYDGSLLKFFMRKVLKFLVEWTTGTKIIDINSGMRIFSKKTINSFLPQLCNTFSFSTNSVFPLSVWRSELCNSFISICFLLYGNDK